MLVLMEANDENGNCAKGLLITSEFVAKYGMNWDQAYRCDEAKAIGLVLEMATSFILDQTCKTTKEHILSSKHNAGIIRAFITNTGMLSGGCEIKFKKYETEG